MLSSSSSHSVPQRSRVIEAVPFYYGWVILAVAILGLVMTQPGQTVGVSVFLDSMIAELGMSRSFVSLLYTGGTLAGSVALPTVGRFIDRRGPRVAVVTIATLFAGACLWMGWVQGSVMLFVGFVLIRSLGQGALALVSVHVVNIWFVRRRGMAVGFLGLGGAIGTGLGPLGMEWLLGQVGWRSSYIAMGLLVAAIMIPVGALFFRAHPERFGLEPDGHASGTMAGAVQERTLSLAQARRTAIFWLFAGGSFLVAGFGTGLLFHHYDMMAGNGLPRALAATFFLPLGLATAVGNLGSGVLIDRLSPRWLLAAVLLLLAGAMLLTMRVDSRAMLLLYGGIIGLLLGMQGTVQGSAYAHYFGRAQIGAIKGLATTVGVAGAAFGPFLFALGPDHFGGYAPVLLVSTVPLFLLALAALLLPEPVAG